MSSRTIPAPPGICSMRQRTPVETHSTGQRKPLAENLIHHNDLRIFSARFARHHVGRDYGEWQSGERNERETMEVHAQNGARPRDQHRRHRPHCARRFGRVAAAKPSDDPVEARTTVSRHSGRFRAYRAEWSKSHSSPTPSSPGRSVCNARCRTVIRGPSGQRACGKSGKAS